ncbi:MAG: glycoside hydrolase family 9 protein, partial [Bacteroidales bacterium]|nr:glycoside hydrolase family 9 protein [Bacteroidales bacterium]
MTKKANHWNRRQFLGTSALGVAGLTILPSFTIDKGTMGHPKPSKLDKLLKDSSYVYKEMTHDVSECAETRWLNKKVEGFVTIYSAGDLENVRVLGRATMALSQDMKYEGKNCVCLTADTKIENIQPRPGCSLDIALPKVDLSAYNRISAWIYPQMTGYQNIYFHFSFGNTGRTQLHAPSLVPNTWNRVTWEIADIERDSVERMGVSPYLPGCPPEALPIMNIYLGEIRAEKVQADDDWGWELKDRIAFCHSGYLPHMKKIAIVQNVTGKNFRLCNESNRAVYEREVREVVNEFGTFYELDFSDFTTCGEYYLQVDNRQTKPFVIDEQALDASVWKSINFMRLLRCGEDVPGVHSACHLNCKVIHPQTQATVPSFGGWHDAGDLSQFEICTAEIAQAMLELALRVKNRDKKLYERLVKEGKVGISWLLRTRFGDGHRALAVTHNMWRDNVLQPNNESMIRVAENGPFENFLASAACAVAAGIYKEEDAVFADWCLRVAEEDFYFAKKGYEQGIYTVRWGTNVDSQVCGAAALAAAELYALTGKEEYVRIGAECAQTIL